MFPTFAAQFPRNIPIVPGESMPGYVLRVASLNGFGTPYSLLTNLGCRGRSLVSDAAFSAIASATAFAEEVSSLKAYAGRGNFGEAAFYVVGQRIEHGYLLDFAHPKICPECLRVQAYARAVWDLSLLAACPLHGTAMVASCSRCGQRLTWWRTGVATCRCGADLRDEPGCCASMEAIWLASCIAVICGLPIGKGCIFPGPVSVARELLGLSLDEFLTAISYFGSYLSHPEKSGPGKARVRVDVSQAAQLACDSYVLIEGWPASVVEAIGTSCRETRWNLNTKRRAMGGSLLSFVRRAFPYRNFVRSTIEEAFSLALDFGARSDRYSDAGRQLSLFPR